MADIIAIPPSNLLLDAENPRLSQPNEGQRETMRTLAKLLNRKLVALAKDIVTNGLNPADLSIVMPANDEENRYYVLEGNRRLVALRALENPDTLVGALDASAIKEMRALSRKYQESPIDLIQCVSMGRDEAEHWIRLRHTGENQGAGIVQWGSDEASRFKARGGSKDLSTQALDYLEKAKALTPEVRKKVPATSLKRLLGTPEIREKVGLGLQDGTLQVLGADKNVVKALQHIVGDLASGDTTVKDIYTKEQRQQYAKAIPKSVAVSAKKKNGHSIETAVVSGASSINRGSSARSAKARDKLIPRDCVLSIKQKRIKAIEHELRTISLTSHPNAVSVLLRVFIELSVDEYIDSNGVAGNANDKLNVKIGAVLNELLTHKKLNAQQAKPVRRVIQKDSYLAPSMNLMHDYIHNQNVYPAAGDLRAYWDSLQPFAMAIWSP